MFRPWMMEFLNRCFKKFKITFWGIKNNKYMEKGSTGDPTNVFTFKRLYTNFHMVNKGLQII